MGSAYIVIEGNVPSDFERKADIFMYLDDDTKTPRDRINDDILRRMLSDDATDHANPCPPPSSAPHHGDGRRAWGLTGYPLASVYAPLQEFHKLYDRENALKAGTIFTELDLPFQGESVAKGGHRRG